MYKLFVFAAFLSIASAHLCLISPKQRGPIDNINKPLDPECFFLDGPCGSSPATTPTVEYNGGENVTIIFQKNENHWNSTNPGSFNIAVQTSANGPFQQIWTIPDENTPHLTLYSASVIIPAVNTPAAVLQVTYVTNSKIGTFYQCADIAVGKV
eukprot:TRINITY_DN1036_c0_g1_i1.p1 TRINITY_DN1036_c0_g1~~TRINITY_DN1036_c0_g1_i1.p1  ORF type:complete len:154 (+),score=40.38 TRINITY_DN1036_c0_g1_i1:41-502(+)